MIWYNYYQTLPKNHRYSLGLKIDKLFSEIIEAIAIASFLSPREKQPWVKLAIRKTDTLKIFLMILWETKSLDTKKYISLSKKIDEIGRMLGGWNGQLTKQNSPK
ncbi:four helix bundle protein [Patescibacteria group bacterium]|nr:four helix bundle protein [Patescibacteria group bacterium]